MTPAAMAPVVPPSPVTFPTGRSPVPSNVPPPARRTSTSSLSHFRLDQPDALDETDGEAERGAGQMLKGLRHADVTLDATRWKNPAFKEKILDLLRSLRIPLWSLTTIRPSSIHLLRISGALTNAVFFVSYNPSSRPTSPTMSPMLTPTLPGMADLSADAVPPTLLLRVYGPSTETLISRSEELRILHTLSSQYGLGPRVEGTFTNGRLEQFFPSRALYASELRDPAMSSRIACRMRELHSVDLCSLGYEQGSDTEATVWRCLREWVGHAREVVNVLRQVNGWEAWVGNFGLEDVEKEVEIYKTWVEGQEGKGRGRVFAHNDTQYGNILLLDRELPRGEPEHHRLIVVDFEYAGPNPRGYDIANHFHEWQADYHHATHSHSLSYHGRYPTLAEREHYYRSYLSLRMNSQNGQEKLEDASKVTQDRVDALEREVRIWSPSSSVLWAVWGLVQAKEVVEALKNPKEGFEPDFDYLSYALERIQMFRKEAKELGVPL